MTVMAQKVDFKQHLIRTRRDTNKESIHSGHFMISDFEAEAQDDEDELAVPVPEVSEPKAVIPCHKLLSQSRMTITEKKFSPNQLSIETSLTKLFQCMSIAYRQKLTSPKWNRFKGVRLRWKDKIRLNNVIWRCWHMQFINKQSTLVCQFASPLDVDTHNKPEAIVLEGKYWKRKLNAVTAEYKKWRMFTHNQILGRPEKYGHDLLVEFENSEWQTPISDSQMMVDEDYMNLMSDTLFSTITGSVPFPFPDTREIARGANLADFIQPSLVQLQPSLDEYMDIEPLHDLLCSKLSTVQEELQPLQSSTFSKNTSSMSSGAVQEKQGVNQNFHSNQYSGTWYIPPAMEYSLPLYHPPPPPPLPPQLNEEVHIGPKPKTKHRSRSNPGLNKKLVSQNSSSNLVQGDVNTRSLQSLSSVSSSQQQQQQQQQQQNTALLQQLLTSSSGSLYNLLESGTNSSKQPTTHNQQCVEVSVPYIPYDSIDNQFLYQSQQSENNRVNSIDQGKSYGMKADSAIQHNSNSLSDTSPSTSLISPVQQSPVQSVVNSPVGCPESPGLQDPLSLSPLNPLSPASPKYVPAYKEHRRVCHINAEQKRRCNIKNGFDTLHSLIPQLHQNPNAKMSKAAMLQKGADYIVQLRNERSSLKQEMDSLRQQIESLNSTICNCQSMLPVTGAPVSRHRSNKMRDMYKQYVKSRTIENWKFWILSLIGEPLLESFNNNVSTNSIEDLYQSTLQWVDQHCTLVDLRPVVLNALRHLCTSTEVLTDPARLPNEARAAVEKYSKKNS